MGTVPFLDFQAIKRAYSIDEMMSMTGLTFKKEGQSFRCECPHHGGGKRGLVVTPNKPDEKGDPGVFYCFGEKAGGDRVALLAHVRGSKPYAIFKELQAKRSPTSQVSIETPATPPEEKEEGSSKERGFRELPYLEADHAAVPAEGFPPEIALAAGIGFAPRGHFRGEVAVPIRNKAGMLLSYISIKDGIVKMPPKWIL